jgi:hypothetical protein
VEAELAVEAGGVRRDGAHRAAQPVGDRGGRQPLGQALQDADLASGQAAGAGAAGRGPGDGPRAAAPPGEEPDVPVQGPQGRLHRGQQRQLARPEVRTDAGEHERGHLRPAPQRQADLLVPAAQVGEERARR